MNMIRAAIIGFGALLAASEAGAQSTIPSPAPQPSVTLLAGENITAPAVVNITSSFHVVYANGSTGLPASGYVTGSALNGAAIVVYLPGSVINGVSALSPGQVFLSISQPGGVTQIVPATGSGAYSQQLGSALSATSFVFQPVQMIGPL